MERMNQRVKYPLCRARSVDQRSRVRIGCGQKPKTSVATENTMNLPMKPAVK